MNQANSESRIPDDACPAIFAELGLGEQDREAQVLRLVMEFMTDDAIARRLGIAKSTVSSNVRRLRERAGAGNRMELAARVVEVRHRIQLGGVGTP